MTWIFAVAALIASGAWVAPPAAQAGPIGDSLGLNPYWHWREIHTEHFVVTFPAELEAGAQRATTYLEEAHAKLAPLLRWSPTLRTQVLIIDNSDAANGLTSSFARLGLVLYLTPPEPQFSTQYYDDWLRLLVFHEYTHLLNLDAADDYYRVLRVLFGDVFLPNLAWPTWMIEGLAVYMETRFTLAGRGRSPEYARIVRTAIEAGVLDDPSFMTLDELTGTRPYAPAGEMPYLFGYFLMDEVARTATADGLTADRRSPRLHPEDALGDLSIRSASRIPFFINGNLENIIGQDWKQTWHNWLARARQQASAELAAIRAAPQSTVTPLAPPSLEGNGIAVTADGKHLAYTLETPDRISHLRLRELGTPEKSGADIEIEKKLLGGTLAFTPDGAALVFSAYQRLVPYRLFSDLRAYDLASKKSYWLTSGARARDPDVSADGKWVAFAQAAGPHPPGSVGLSIAPLTRETGASSGRLELGAIEAVPGTAPLDRVSSPRFARDGRTVYFCLHRNGRKSVEIAAWDRETKQLSILVDNGAFNRDLSVTAGTGELLWVSDLGGVENAYRLGAHGPERITSVTSGIHFPVRAGSLPSLYATVYTNAGWQLSQLTEVPPTHSPSTTPGAPNAAAVVDPPPLAKPATPYEVHDYTAWHSLLPRQWLVLPLLYPGGFSLMGQVTGFDAVDRHSYSLGLGYNTSIHFPDAQVFYSNRSFGPTLSVSARTVTESYTLTSSSLYPGGIQSYLRRNELSGTVSFPFVWTFSSLVPVVGAEVIRDSLYRYPPGQGDATLVASSPAVPSVDFALYTSSALAPRLAVAPEEGRSAFGGARVYLDGGQSFLKGSLRDQEFWNLGRHFVLSPSAHVQWTSALNPASLGVNTVVEGRSPSLFTNPSLGAFDSMRARGYSGQAYFTRGAGQLALDLRFPLVQIFRGWDTYPIFLNQFYALAFGEASWVTASDLSLGGWLPSAGVGLRLSTELLLRLPLTLSWEFHQGLREDAGGRSDLFLQILLNSFQF